MIAWLTVPGYEFVRTQNIFAVASVVLGLVVFGLSRWSELAPQRLLDIGLVFEVAGAFGISVAQFWNGFVPLRDLPEPLLPAFRGSARGSSSFR